MQSIKFSIIIPVYNCEKYISRCIESWQHQTYSNFELVVVDDGSADKSKEVCEKYQSKDNRIKLICTENFGVSHARNVGLYNATGDFIGFCDADDYVHPQTLEIVTNVHNKYKSDIVTYEYKRVPDSTVEVIHPKYNLESIKKKTYNSEEFIKHMCLYADKAIWNKFFKKSVVSSINFNEDLTHGEDFNWLLKVFVGNIEYKNISHICVSLYYYVSNPNSATVEKSRKFDKYGQLKSLKTTEMNYDKFKEASNSDMNAYLMSDIFYCAMQNLYFAKKYHISIDSKILVKLKSYIHKYYKVYFFKSKSVFFKNKIKSVVKLIYISNI